MATSQPGALDLATDLFLVANRAATTLNGGISDVATAITVTDASAFPSTGRFKITIADEIIDIASRSGNDLTAETRGAEGTSGATHADTTAVTMQFTAGHFEALRDAIIATQEGYMRRPAMPSDPGNGVTTFGAPAASDTFTLRRAWTW